MLRAVDAVIGIRDSVDDSGSKSANVLALFPSEAEWTRTRVLEANAVEKCDFDLESFARHPPGASGS